MKKDFFKDSKIKFPAYEPWISNDDQKIGVDIVRRALFHPLRQIAENAGVDGAVVAGKIRESKDINLSLIHI